MMSQSVVSEVCYQGGYLNNRTVPPIANKNGLKADVVSTGNVFGVLTFDIFAKNWSVVSTIALWQKFGVSRLEIAGQMRIRTRREMKRVSCILRECPHETL